MSMSRGFPVLANSLGRRAFLQQGTLVLTATAALGQPLLAASKVSRVRVGLLTDLHYADKPPAGSRHYRETLDKLAEAADTFGEKSPDFLVELGDLIDAADSVEVEQRYLQTIQRAFTAAGKPRYYVLGNHCVDTLTKAEFLAGVEQERSYFSFPKNGFRFLVLDACFRGDGEPYGRKNSHWTDANIPPEELEWLEAELRSNADPLIVFAHQRLDVGNKYGVKNNAAVRALLESTGRVLAVLQGHSHQNDFREINGIPYCTLAAMVEGTGPENNGYSVMEIAPDLTIRLTGFRRQTSYEWERPT